MIGERAFKYPGAEFPRNLRSPVRAAAIHNHNFVGGPLNGLQDPRQVSLFVLRHDADSQVIHLRRTLPLLGDYLNFGRVGLLAWRAASPILSWFPGGKRRHSATPRRARVLRRKTHRWSSPHPYVDESV